MLLPLLRKDLAAHASLGRRAALRFAVVAGLYALFFNRYALVESHQLGAAGAALIEEFRSLLLLAILAVVPALSCSTISGERARGTLDLLLTSRLGRFEIVAQKYLAVVIPMVMLVFAMLPPMALAFALGGVEPQTVGDSLLVLTNVILLVAAIGVFSSALCDRTGAALGLTYGVVLILVFFFPSLSFLISDRPGELKMLRIGLPLLFSFQFITWAQIVMQHDCRRYVSALRSLFSIPAWIVKTAALRALGGEREKSDVRRRQLPRSNPIHWRESTRRSASGRGRTRWAEITSALLVLGCVLAVAYEAREGGDFVAIWAVVSAIVILRTVVSLFEERDAGTIDVLLTTALSPLEMLLDKERALLRITLYLAVPVVLGTVTGPNVLRGDYLEIVWLFLFAILSAVVYLPLIAWATAWACSRCTTRERTLTVVLAVLFGLNLSPFVVLLATRVPEETWHVARLVPGVNVGALALVDNGSADFAAAYTALAIHAVIAFTLRAHCLRNARAVLVGPSRAVRASAEPGQSKA